MKSACVVVIGHVDHGKTSLVRALTGIETDRLAEEKQRGLSITNGYAHMSYATGTIDFIDAPGHEDFIAAMVAGATGARAALVVISAIEGVCAQTREHLAIAALLGIKTAIIAVTKADLLAPPAAASAVESIQRDLADTHIAAMPLVLCSAATGSGLEQLHSALESILDHPLDTLEPLHSFLPVDRVFSMAGRGTIVTGTLLGGSLTAGETATLYPTHSEVGLRGLHCRGAETDQIMSGSRTAVNLRGVSVADVPRGAVLSVGGDVAPALCIDIAVDLLAAHKQPPKHNEQLRVLFGTTNEVARIRYFAGNQYAQLRFTRPVVAYAGQRAILRNLSPPRTIGGAVILDPQAAVARAKDERRLNILRAAACCDIAETARAIAAAHGGIIHISDLARLARKQKKNVQAALSGEFETIGAEVMCPRKDLERCKSDIIEELMQYHESHPLRRGAPRSVLGRHVLAQHAIEQLEHSGAIQSHGATLALHDHDPFANLSEGQSARLAQIERSFEEAALMPPAPPSLEKSDEDGDLVNLLTDAGRLVRLHNIALRQIVLLHPSAISAAQSALSAAFPAPLGFTTSQARIALATTRRVIVPLLEHFDAEKITCRTGDLREMNIAKGVPHESPN